MSVTWNVGIGCMIIVFLGLTAMNVFSLQTADAMTSGYNTIPSSIRTIPSSIRTIPSSIGTIPPPTLPPSNETVSGGTTTPSAGGTTTLPAPVKVEYFLKIDGIEGESQVGGESGAIELVGWSWGEANPNSATFQNDLNQAFQQQSSSEIIVTKPMDVASPKLFEACASGQHIKSVEIDGVADLGSGPQEFFTITFTDVMISSYQVSGSGSENPTEQVSFNFGKIEQPQWDQTVLQKAASQRMTDAIELKTNTALANTPLTAPTPRAQIHLTYDLSTNVLDLSGEHTVNIDISSWSWGVTNNGKAAVSDFSFTKNPTESLPLNFATIKPTSVSFECNTGEHIVVDSFLFGTPEITVTPPDGIDYKFSQIVIEHEGLGSPVKAGWDLQANAPISSLAPNAQGLQVPASKVPSWIRNNAKWWAGGQLSDLEFEAGIKYLIDNHVIKLNVTQPQENSSQSEIPSWVKHDAEWWSQGLISDDQFLKSLEYMVNHGLIKLNKVALATVMKVE